MNAKDETGAVAPLLADDDLHELDSKLEDAFRSGNESSLRVIGYGEVSCVVAWPGKNGDAACKRLPPFPNDAAFSTYEATFSAYLETLAARGVTPVQSQLASLHRADGSIGAFCVQPILPEGSLLPDHFRAVDEGAAASLFTEILDHIDDSVDNRVGLDGQLSNWALVAGELQYLDVTTPMLRDDAGEDRLDTGIFIASLPWMLRGLVRRFMLQDILDRYYDRRRIVVDLLGNLHKERLAQLIDPFIDLTAGRFDRPITRREVDAYYAEDKRTWTLLLALRRMDRSWQLRFRRRSYPFLLPGKIER